MTVYFLIVLLSTAMGIQTTVGRRLGVAGISTTVLTNNLANVVEDVMHQFRSLRRREKNPVFNKDSLLRLLAIIIYCAGAVIAAAAQPFYPHVLIWLPICLLGCVIGVVLIRFKSIRGLS
jgi:uncharacterized membrane protein YoaK (UPF0700 family)